MTRTLSTAQWLALERGRRVSAMVRAARRAQRLAAEMPERRVVACSGLPGQGCDRTAEWRGWLDLLRAGWSWDWRRGKVAFLCPGPHEEDS